MKLRKHQEELRDLLEALNGDCSQERPVLLSVTPGGGKSMAPQVALSVLRRSKCVDKLCWVVPRENLQSQAASGFMDPVCRQLVGHNLRIYEATNECDPSRGTDGYVTTYQAIAADSAGINRYELQRSRYLLVLDEIHHVRAGGPWHARLQPLVDAATFVILMTGTLERADRSPIAFLPYKEVSNACA